VESRRFKRSGDFSTLAVAASKAFPGTTAVRANDTHRFIASKHAGGSVLSRLADSAQHLDDIFALDDATNDRTLIENGIPRGIDIHELVFGVPYHHIVNAAFTHPHPLGSRFNGPGRGAWYAALDLATAKAEVSYHKAVDLIEIGVLEDDVTYDDYAADFRADFHDLRGVKRFAKYMNPASYVASQKLAEELLASGALGVIYPSVRHSGGSCIACFRPALVTNVTKRSTYRFVWSGTPVPRISLVSST
jgi:hypothetical protein